MPRPAACSPQVGIRSSAALQGGWCSCCVAAPTSCTGNAPRTLRQPWLAWGIHWLPLTSQAACRRLPPFLHSIVGTTLDADGALWLVLSNRMMVRSDVCSGEPVGIDEVEAFRLDNKGVV